MVIRRQYEEWPDACRRQNYPFSDAASRLDTSRELEIPAEYLLDARFWPNKLNGRLFIRSIDRSPAGLAFQLDDLDGPLMTAFVALQDITSTVKLIFRHVGNNTVGGWIRFAPGGLQNLYDTPNGLYRFSAQATEIVTTAVSVVLYQGVNSLQAEDANTGEQASVVGDILIMGGRGVRLEVDDGRIVVNVVGDPYARRDVCGEIVEEHARLGALLNPLRSIQLADLTTSVQQTVTPLAGTLITTMLESERIVDHPDAGPGPAEAFHSPGRDGELLTGIAT